MLNLGKLRDCVVVAELGSFTRAASFLAMPQSVLSRHVRDIEELLGVALLHRTGRGVVLSEAGRALLPELQTLVAGGDALLEHARQFHGVVSGTVRLGILTALAPVLLAPLFSLAAERLPNVHLNVMDGLTQHLDELLVNGRLDLALLYKDREAPQPTDEALLQVDLCLIGPAGDRLTRDGTIRLADLAGVPLTLPALPNRMRRAIAHVCRQQGIALTVTANLDSVVPLKELAAAGKTHTILPPYFVRTEVDAGRLQAARIVDPPITRTVLIASATQGAMSRACVEIVALIREVAVGLVASGVLQARLMATASTAAGAPPSGRAQTHGTRAPSRPRRARAAGKTGAPSRKPSAHLPA